MKELEEKDHLPFLEFLKRRLNDYKFGELVKEFNEKRDFKTFDWTFMYGDGDGHHTEIINPADYDTTFEVIEAIADKSSNYAVDTILNRENSNKNSRLTDEEVEIFSAIYDNIPDIGGFKQSYYVHA